MYTPKGYPEFESRSLRKLLQPSAFAPGFLLRSKPEKSTNQPLSTLFFFFLAEISVLKACFALFLGSPLFYRAEREGFHPGKAERYLEGIYAEGDQFRSQEAHLSAEAEADPVEEDDSEDGETPQASRRTYRFLAIGSYRVFSASSITFPAARHRAS